MTEDRDRGGARGEDKVLLIKCVRTGEHRSPGEHRDCPYCFGKARDVVAGDRSRFCDFEPGKDPIVFGFPPGTSRDK